METSEGLWTQFSILSRYFFQCSSQSAMRERSKNLESLYVRRSNKLSLRRSPFVGVLTLKTFHTLQINRIKSSV